MHSRSRATHTHTLVASLQRALNSRCSFSRRWASDGRPIESNLMKRIIRQISLIIDMKWNGDCRNRPTYKIHWQDKNIKYEFIKKITQYWKPQTTTAWWMMTTARTATIACPTTIERIFALSLHFFCHLLVHVQEVANHFVADCAPAQ